MKGNFLDIKKNSENIVALSLSDMHAFISVSEREREREIADASMRAVSKPSDSDEHVSNVVWRNGRRIRRGRGAEKRNSVTTCVNRTFSGEKISVTPQRSGRKETFE